MYHRCSTFRNKCTSSVSYFKQGTYPYSIAMLAIQLLGSKMKDLCWEIINPSCHLYRILGSCSWSHVTRYGNRMYKYDRTNHPKATRPGLAYPIHRVVHIHPTWGFYPRGNTLLGIDRYSTKVASILLKLCFESQVPSMIRAYTGVNYVHTYRHMHIRTYIRMRKRLAIRQMWKPGLKKTRRTETKVTHLYCIMH